MYKYFILTITSLFVVLPLSAQTAREYFPSQTGHLWYYTVTPLDSLNNTLDSLKFYRIDSFAVTQSYEGKLAEIVLSKSDSLETILPQPFTDSLFFHFDSSDAFNYEQVDIVEPLLLFLDSLGIDSSFSFLNFFRSLENWYNVYRFASPVGNQYTIFLVDTSIIVDSITVPLRFDYLGRRLNDDTLDTQIGTFDCKKFYTKRGMGIRTFLPPPLPQTIPIVEIEDTIWLAPGNWMVKSVIPSARINLSPVGFGSFPLPGLLTEIMSEITNVQTDEGMPPVYLLRQNYPNPFNPATTIKFQIPNSGFVGLKVYDILGNEIVTLLDEEKTTGSYEIEFTGNGLSSGIYYYRLQAGNYMDTKKMILIK